MNNSTAWRSAAAIRILLVAALAAAAFLGAFAYFSGNTSTSADGNGDPANPEETDAQVVSFTTADTGSCLTWRHNPQGEVTNFETTSCEDEHRFEVSTREDLSTFPTSEFGPDAAMPDVERQNALRDELCQAATVRYLEGKFDPSGKYDIASILPPAAAWEQGDRTMLCGLQTTDINGEPQLTTGKVANVDQALVAEPGTCLALEDNQRGLPVDCAEDHQLETVSIIDLNERFPDGYPSDEDMDNFLGETCTANAEEYLGGEEQLYQSTLQPFWGSLSETSWNTGSRSVNCSLIHTDGDGFSTITGTAKDGRDGLRINGESPEERPDRNPLRSEQDNNTDNTPAAPTPAAPAPAA